MTGATVTGMTAPEPTDLSAEADHLIQRTDNGLKPGDPPVQPPQDPGWRPEGTETEQGQ